MNQVTKIRIEVITDKVWNEDVIKRFEEFLSHYFRNDSSIQSISVVDSETVDDPYQLFDDVIEEI